MMKTLYQFLILFTAGCASRSPLGTPSRSELVSILGGQQCIATESGFEDASPWVKRDSEIRYELGRWLPEQDGSLLVTVDVLEACHAEGFVHHLVAVLDPHSRELLTPVFHLVADHAKRRILVGEEQDALVYDAYKDRSFTDVSYLLRFHRGGLDTIPAIGSRDPEKFDFGGVKRNTRNFVIQEFEWRGNYDKGERHRYITQTIPVTWNPSTLSLEEQRTGQQSPAGDVLKAAPEE